MVTSYLLIAVSYGGAFGLNTGTNLSDWTQVAHGSASFPCEIGEGDGGFTLGPNSVGLAAWSHGGPDCGLGVGRVRRLTMPNLRTAHTLLVPLNDLYLTGLFATGVSSADGYSTAVFGLQAWSQGAPVGPVHWYGSETNRTCSDVPASSIEKVLGNSAFAIPLRSVSGGQSFDELQVELLACPLNSHGTVYSSLRDLKLVDAASTPPQTFGEVAVTLQDGPGGGLLAVVTNTGQADSMVNMEIWSTLPVMSTASAPTPLKQTTLVPTDPRCGPPPTSVNADPHYNCAVGTLSPGQTTTLLFGYTRYAGTINITGYPFYIEARITASSDQTTSNNTAVFRI